MTFGNQDGGRPNPDTGGISTPRPGRPSLGLPERIRHLAKSALHRGAACSAAAAAADAFSVAGEHQTREQQWR